MNKALHEKEQADNVKEAISSQNKNDLQKDQRKQTSLGWGEETYLYIIERTKQTNKHKASKGVDYKKHRNRYIYTHNLRIRLHSKYWCLYAFSLVEAEEDDFLKIPTFSRMDFIISS